MFRIVSVVCCNVLISYFGLVLRLFIGLFEEMWIFTFILPCLRCVFLLKCWFGNCFGMFLRAFGLVTYSGKSASGAVLHCFCGALVGWSLSFEIKCAGLLMLFFSGRLRLFLRDYRGGLCVGNAGLEYVLGCCCGVLGTVLFGNAGVSIVSGCFFVSFRAFLYFSCFSVSPN